MDVSNGQVRNQVRNLITQTVPWKKWLDRYCLRKVFNDIQKQVSNFQNN